MSVFLITEKVDASDYNNAPIKTRMHVYTYYTHGYIIIINAQRAVAIPTDIFQHELLTTKTILSILIIKFLIYNNFIKIITIITENVIQF